MSYIKTKIYAPVHNIYIKRVGQKEVLIPDLDVLDFHMDLEVGTTNSLSMTLSNDGGKYTNIDDGKMFLHCHDEIVVYLGRSANNTHLCFSGYLTKVPVRGLAPTVSIEAMGAMKVLANIYFDDGNKDLWINVLNLSGEVMGEATEFADNGYGLIIEQLLKKVAGWPDNRILIGDIPEEMIEDIAKLKTDERDFATSYKTFYEIATGRPFTSGNNTTFEDFTKGEINFDNIDDCKIFAKKLKGAFAKINKDYKLSDREAAAIMGNIRQESSGVAKKIEIKDEVQTQNHLTDNNDQLLVFLKTNKSLAIGIGFSQWTGVSGSTFGDRAEKLINFAKAQTGSDNIWSNINVQFSYYMKEMEDWGASQLKGAGFFKEGNEEKDIESLTLAYNNIFERGTVGKRVQYAKAILTNLSASGGSESVEKNIENNNSLRSMQDFYNRWKLARWIPQNDGGKDIPVTAKEENEYGHQCISLSERFACEVLGVGNGGFKLGKYSAAQVPQAIMAMFPEKAPLFDVVTKVDDIKPGAIWYMETKDFPFHTGVCVGDGVFLDQNYAGNGIMLHKKEAYPNITKIYAINPKRENFPNLGPNIEYGSSGSSGSSSTSTNPDGQLTMNDVNKHIFNALYYAWTPDLATSYILQGDRAVLNDKTLLYYINKYCSAVMREWMQTPDGKFFAFFPDYFGDFIATGQNYDVEIPPEDCGHVVEYCNDRSLVTHSFYYGNKLTGGFLNGGMNVSIVNMATSGVALIDNEYINKFLRVPEGLENDIDFNFSKLIERYGVRIEKQENQFVGKSEMEIYGAIFNMRKAWSERYQTSVDFSFLPHIYPGMRIAFSDIDPKYNNETMTAYVNSVHHSYSLSSGYTTRLVLSCFDKVRNHKYIPPKRKEKYFPGEAKQSKDPTKPNYDPSVPTGHGHPTKDF